MRRILKGAFFNFYIFLFNEFDCPNVTLLGQDLKIQLPDQNVLLFLLCYVLYHHFDEVCTPVAKVNILCWQKQSRVFLLAPVY